MSQAKNSLAGHGFKTVPKHVFLAQRTLALYAASEKAADEGERVAAKHKKKQDELAAELAAQVAQWRADNHSSGDEGDVLDDVDEEGDGPHGMVVIGDEGAKKTSYRKRPDNWRVIGHYGAQYGLSRAVTAFRTSFDVSMESSAVKSAVNRFIADFKSGKKEGRRPTRKSVIGVEEEDGLVAAFWQRSHAGLSLLDDDLRLILVGILAMSEKLHLLKEHGGKYSFRGSWFSRFYRRHGISLRVATSKMRVNLRKLLLNKGAHEFVLV